MIITRKSSISGKTHQMDIPVTEQEILAYNSGVLVQRAFPNLSAEQREFIMTGITPEEWLQFLGPEED